MKHNGTENQKLAYYHHNSIKYPLGHIFSFGSEFMLVKLQKVAIIDFCGRLSCCSLFDGDET